jgi:hypothetical protein
MKFRITELKDALDRLPDPNMGAETFNFVVESEIDKSYKRLVVNSVRYCTADGCHAEWVIEL